MPRAIWSGAISFGLVNVPVKLVTAVKKKNVSFREIRKNDGSRIRHKRVSASDGEEVAQDDIAKGYEISPDRYVVVSPDELRSLDPKTTRAIEIQDFVDLDQIDPIYYDSPYYLVPEETAQKPYKLLHEAMTASGKVGIARFVLRTKQYLAAIRPVGPALAISTMAYHDEVIDPSDLEGLPAEDVTVTKKELDTARRLIEELAGDFDPTQYDDEYRARVLELIERKADGEEIVEVPDGERESAKVVDLMSALEASLEAAKESRPKRARKTG